MRLDDVLKYGHRSKLNVEHSLWRPMRSLKDDMSFCSWPFKTFPSQVWILDVKWIIVADLPKETIWDMIQGQKMFVELDTPTIIH